MIIRFNLLGEGDGLSDVVDVFVEFILFVLSMRPTHIGVIHIPFPPFRSKGEGSKGKLFEVLYEKVGNDRRKRRAHGYSLDLLINDALEGEKSGSEAQLHQTGDLHIGLALHNLDGIRDWDLGEERDHIKAHQDIITIKMLVLDEMNKVGGVLDEGI